MKNLITLIAAIVLVSGFTTVSAQVGVSATATGSATIITPLSITKNVDMNFGAIAVNANAGTVVLSPLSVRTPSGGVTLPTSAIAVSSAAFAVTGLNSATYAITLPTTLTLTSGSNNMSVNAFTLSTGAGTLSATGTQTINVGATLSVGASQAAGAYVSATPFTVTVNYN
jgi:hypothetical protein